MKNKKHIKIATIFFSLLFGIFGLTAIIKPDFIITRFLDIPAEEAIKWFGLSFIAFIFPYLREISISGYGFKMWDEIQKTREKIETLEGIIKSQKTESREFLIKSFLEYINLLNNEKDKNQKVFKLNEIYFRELGIEQSTVKKALNAWIDKDNIQECNKINDLSDSISIELINALRIFQKRQKLPPDGIFGYYTCEKIKEYIN